MKEFTLILFHLEWIFTLILFRLYDDFTLILCL